MTDYTNEQVGQQKGQPTLTFSNKVSH